MSPAGKGHHGREEDLRWEGIRQQQKPKRDIDIVHKAVEVLATRYYTGATGFVHGAGLWNVANTLEALANYLIYTETPPAAHVEAERKFFRERQALLGDTCDCPADAIDAQLSLTAEGLSEDSATAAEMAISLAGIGAHLFTEYNDDLLWWALAHARMFEWTRAPRYLVAAETIVNYTFEVAADSAVCGGGLWWKGAEDNNPPHAGKNAIENELAIAAAAKLYRLTGTKAHLDRATGLWLWFQQVGMLNSSTQLINDGIDTNEKSANFCKNNEGLTWTYNQGVILGGLIELSQVTGNASLIGQACAIADAVISRLTADGILREPVPDGFVEDPHNHDAVQFKGIFVRYLGYLKSHINAGGCFGGRCGCTSDAVMRYEVFLFANRASLLANATDRSAAGGELGPWTFTAVWTGPFNHSSALAQTSGLDLLNAAMAK
ncbi:hypothetical protein CYMTET_44762 [Cymbomonas tetramitiformis]|uniref:Glycoside hydrolase family 76 protein n=1 Tax=Cymbomonas tetramitiformis TaxID=36881 RepID=A0AAE0C1F0_9CHLO|nr:hypothetical protein CYMTET_44762 [Cymbomonas tetramitiformis]|eukprot:gene19188-22938_t